VSELTRFSVSIEKGILDAFDAMVAREGYPTRSEAVKALIRDELIEKEWESSGIVAGALVLVYDHHKHDLVHRLMHIQHDHGDAIISSQHVHLDHDNCLEVITVKGKTRDIQELVAGVKSIKGIKHSSLVMTTAGEGVP